MSHRILRNFKLGKEFYVRNSYKRNCKKHSATLERIWRRYHQGIYRELFSRYPEVKGMFDMEKQKSGQQPKALAMAILNAAKNIDNLEKIRPSVESIGKIHVGLHVLPEHYPLTQR